MTKAEDIQRWVASAVSPLKPRAFVASLDSRSAGGRGKRFLDAIYLKLGTVEIDDQAAGVKALRQRPYVDGGRVGKAWSSGQMFRGIETILLGRDPRDAWLFTQRFCGVCTTVHALASVRTVEDALGINRDDPIGHGGHDGLGLSPRQFWLGHHQLADSLSLHLQRQHQAARRSVERAAEAPALPRGRREGPRLRAGAAARRA